MFWAIFKRLIELRSTIFYKWADRGPRKAMNETMNEILDFLQKGSTSGFSGKKVFPQAKSNGGVGEVGEESAGKESFAALFNVEGIPLFWFYKRYLLPHVLPRPLNTYAALAEMKKLSLVQKARLQLSSTVLRKYIFFNEHKKIKRTSEQRAYPPTKKALFLTYFSHRGSDNRLYRIQGIIDQFQKEAWIEPFPLFMTPLSAALPKRDSRALTTIYQYADETILQTAQRQARLFAERWKKIDVSALSAGLTFDTVSTTTVEAAADTTADAALNSKRPLWPYLRYAFALFMSREFLSIIFLYYELSKKIIEKENVALVFISGQNGLGERCIAAAARTKGIPCLLVPHGYALKNLPSEDILDNMYLPVFDQTTRQIFVAAGVPAKQVRVTGPAMYDTIIKYKRRRSKRSSNRRSEVFSKNILLLTQPLVEDNLMAEDQFFRLVETIVMEMRKITGAIIAIKLHPRERGWRRYQKIIKHIQDQARGERNQIFLYQQGESDLLYRSSHYIGTRSKTA